MTPFPKDEGDRPEVEQSVQQREPGGDVGRFGTSARATRLQERILASCTWVSEQEARSILRLSTKDLPTTFETMTAAGEVLRVMADGHPAYPSFQFDTTSHRVLPAVTSILAAKPASWSDYRLLNWFTTPHVEFGCAPAQAIASHGDDVVAAFGREAQPPLHG